MLFDYTSLFAEFSFPHIEFIRAHDALLKTRVTYLLKLSVNDLHNLFKIPLSVEHEYFHCRTLVSSSIGYLIYLTTQRATISKTNLIRISYPTFAKWRRSNEGQYINFLQGNKEMLKQCGEDFKDLMREDVTLDVLKNFSKQTIEAFYKINDITNRFSHICGLDGKRPIDGYIPELFSVAPPSNDLFSLYESSASMIEILEGLAMWKEYAYLSRFAWIGFRPHFGYLTRKWLKATDGNHKYRKVADLILNKTGCNMSMALPGVLIDLALGSPCFTLRRCNWDEVHPSLRLARILSVVDRIPPSMKKVDNCELVPEQFYADVEKIICRTLGWSHINETIRETLTAMEIRMTVAAQKTFNAPDLFDIAGRIYDRRFYWGLISRLKCPSIQLFPWNSPNKDLIGSLTKPIFSLFPDKIEFAKHPNESDTEMFLYINDVIITLFVNALINPNIISTLSHEVYRKCRKIYSLRPTAFPDFLWKKLGLDTPSNFESFITKHLYFDYNEYMYPRPAKEYMSPKPLSPNPTGMKIGRNSLCPCGSGKKHKRCCGS